VARKLAAHIAVREAVQFFVDQRCQIFEGRLVALPPGDKQPRYLFWGVCLNTKPLWALRPEISTSLGRPLGRSDGPQEKPIAAVGVFAIPFRFNE